MVVKAIPATVSHFRVEDSPLILKIEIASPRRWRPILDCVSQLIIFAVMYAFVFVFFVPFLLRADATFLFWILPFVLIFWLVVGLSYLQMLLWDLSGVEIVEIDPNSILIRHNLLGRSDSDEYLAEHIKDLRYSHWNKPYESRARNPFIFKLSKLCDNPLSFDYGAKTIRFGNNIEEAEAKQILRIIEARFPAYLIQSKL